MKNDPYVAEPFGPVANIGRRLREIFGESYGDLDNRMLDLLYELDFIPSSRPMGSSVEPIDDRRCGSEPA